jgi:hypothetical protein
MHQQTEIAMILARCEGLRFIHNYAGYAPVHLVATLGSLPGLQILFPSHWRVTESEMFHRQQAVGGGDGVEEGEKGLEVPLAFACLNTPQQRELDQKATYTGSDDDDYDDGGGGGGDNDDVDGGGDGGNDDDDDDDDDYDDDDDDDSGGDVDDDDFVSGGDGGNDDGG